jgi:DNA-binding IclR family transcriptional regulator
LASQGRGIQSIEVGGRLINALTRTNRPMMLRDLAAEAGITPAQAHAYLASYRKVELVEQDAVSGMYRLGPFAMRLGMARLRTYEPLRDATEAAVALSARLGVLVAVAVWGNGAPTLVQVQEGARPVNINSRPGTVYSVIGTITGRVMAAFRDDAEMRQRIEMEFASQSTLGLGAKTTRAQFEEAKARIRKDGYATASALVIPDLNGISAPVFDRNGELLYVLSLIGNMEDLDIDPRGEPVKILRETCRALTDRLRNPAGLGEAAQPPPKAIRPRRAPRVSGD